MDLADVKKNKYKCIVVLLLIALLPMFKIQVADATTYTNYPAPNVTINYYDGTTLRINLPPLDSIGIPPGNDGDGGLDYEARIWLYSGNSLVYQDWASPNIKVSQGNVVYTLPVSLNPNQTYGLQVYYHSHDRNGSISNDYYSAPTNLLITNNSINLNFTATPLNWDPVRGRGRIQLSWNNDPGYTSYRVEVFNGYTWESFNPTSGTTFDTSVEKIYPSETTLDSFSANSQSSIFDHNRGGLDLADNPNKLYIKTIGTGYDGSTNYQFRVVGTLSNSGSGSMYPFAATKYSNTVAPSLPNRTDSSPPTGNIEINNGASYVSSTLVTLNLSGSDVGSGISQMQFSNDNSIWSDWEGYATTKSWSLTSGDGVKTVYVRFKDSAGNISNIYTDNIQLDTIQPTGSISINSGAAMTNSTSVTLTLSASDNSSGISQMQFSNDNTSWSAWENYVTTKTWTLATGDGNKTVYVKFKDAAGNISSAYSDTIKLDSTAPTGSININNSAEWATSDTVTLALSASDSGSGISQMQFSNDNTNWSAWENYAATKTWTLTTGDGTKTVYVKFKDAAGNISSAYSDTIKLDVIKPTGTITINNGDAKTGIQNVKLQITANDNYSGVDQIRFSKDGTTWDAWTNYDPSIYYDYQIEGGTGPRYVYLQIRDKAGNISDPVRDDITLKDDNQGPVVSLKINNDAQLTTTTSIKLTISTYDDLTPIDQLQMRFSNDGKAWSAWESVAFVKDWTLSSDEGQKNVFIQVKDASGNTTTAGDTIDYYANPAEYNETIQQTEVDSEPPVIKSVKISTGATILTSNSVPLSIVANDNMGTSGLKMSFSNNGTSWQTPVAYTAKYTVTGLSFSSGYNVLYVKVIDAYGNEAVDSIEFFKK